ncbi:hypothetical protein V3C99_004137, partial [Haemonchus contortus]
PTAKSCSRMIWLLVFYSCIALSMACFCTPAQGTKESFCKADWVSHVTVLGRKRNPDPNGDKIYVLQHIDVYKRPQSTTQLPAFIYTPSSSAACGIRLKVGSEYLLAGATRSKNYFFTFRCGQIVDDSQTVQTEYGMPIEWKHVSSETKSALTSINCDNYRDITLTNQRNK